MSISHHIIKTPIVATLHNPNPYHIVVFEDEGGFNYVAYSFDSIPAELQRLCECGHPRNMITFVEPSSLIVWACQPFNLCGGCMSRCSETDIVRYIYYKRILQLLLMATPDSHLIKAIIKGGQIVED